MNANTMTTGEFCFEFSLTTTEILRRLRDERCIITDCVQEKSGDLLFSGKGRISPNHFTSTQEFLSAIEKTMGLLKG